MTKSTQTFSVDKEFQMVFIAPIWFSIASVGMSPEKRPSLLSNLLTKFNEFDPEKSWQLEKFDAPRTIKFRKFGQIWRPFQFSKEFISSLSEIYGQDLSESIFSRLTVYDYGLGNIEVTLKITVDSAQKLQAITETAKNIKLSLVEEFNTGVPNADLELNKLDEIYGEFAIKELAGVENNLKPNYDISVVSPRASFMCGPVSRNLLFIDSHSVVEQFLITAKDVNDVAHIFLNEACDDFGITDSEKIPISHEGFEGAVAIVRKSTPLVNKELNSNNTFADMCMTEDDNVKRTKLLWSLVHLYWSALYCSSEGYFVISAATRVNNYNSVSEIHAEVNKIESYQSIISMLKFESKPEKVTVEGEDLITYSRIWDAYKSEHLIHALTQIQNDTEQSLVSLRDKMQELASRRVKRLLAVFTLLTIVSVIIDVIQFYDVSNTLAPLPRLFYLGETIIGLFGVIFIFWCFSLFQYKSAGFRNRR